MAELASKESVLQMLYPQPSDGTGPGYISALDVQTTCGNLYDQVALVNNDLTSDVVWDPINNALTTTAGTFDAMIDVLADSAGVLRPYATIEQLTTALYGALLSRYQVRYVVQPGTTIPSLYPIHQYIAALPVNWPVEDSAILVTTSGQPAPGAVPTGVKLWWNGINTQIVDPAGAPVVAGKYVGTPYAVAPGDFFRTGSLEVLAPIGLTDVGMRGDDASWTDPSTQSFVIRDLTGLETRYSWDPDDQAFDFFGA